MPPPSLLRVLNFPGFGDLRDSVEHHIHDQIHNCNLAIYIVKNSEFVQREEIERFQMVRAAARQMIVVFNFCDKLDPDEFELKTSENKKRLGVEDVVLASLKPKGDENSPYFETAVCEIKKRVNWWAEHDRKKAPTFPEELI